jgi:hypothetical protein
MTSQLWLPAFNRVVTGHKWQSSDIVYGSHSVWRGEKGSHISHNKKPRNLQTIQGYSKWSIHFQKCILQKLLTLNPCPVYGWKGNHSKFWFRWSEAAHHWGCGCCSLWHAATSVGRVGLSIWHLPYHTWGSHRVLVRCENNFERSPFNQNIVRRHMFNVLVK